MSFKQEILAHKKGDLQASRRLYLLSYKSLYSIAYRYVPYEDQAKDVVQNTYLKIFKNLSQMKHDSDTYIKAWMKRICINEALQFLRSKRNWNKLQNSEKSIVVKNDHQLYKDEILNTLLKLPERQRIVFSLFALDGYKHKEIAQMLGINENNSRTIVGRARNFLAQNINKETLHETA